MKAVPLPSLALSLALGLGAAHAGPYSAASGDPAKDDAPIPGFIGPHGPGASVYPDGFGGFYHLGNYVNPVFFGWIETVLSYEPAPGVAGAWSFLPRILGPVTGDELDIVSLGDAPSGTPPGSITLEFAQPIHDLTGADFAVFENAFLLGSGGGTIFGELAYVEASSDGLTYVRFPSASLTPAPVPAYGIIDPTNVRGLAGKHLNADAHSWGTPFDLAEIGLPTVRYLRLVDVPGTGTALDTAGRPIYDPTLTTSSGGFDLEAIGVISRLMTFDEWQDFHALAGDTRGPDADPDADGLPNLLEYAFSRTPHRPDSPHSPIAVEKNADRLEITFTRDQRLTDLTYEVQARDNLASGPWITLATSTGGAPFTPVPGFTPTITETRASPIATLGVVRKVRVTDIQTLTGHPSRFLRVKVTLPEP